MCKFWVQGVWNRHAAVNPAERWAAFMASPFYPFVPQVQWPSETWTLDRVKRTLAAMRTRSSPGLRGFPIALWKILPEAVHQSVADLLAQVEAEGRWPVAGLCLHDS